MPSDGSNHNEPMLDKVRRIENTLEEINTRIARLSILLNVKLDKEEDITKILSREATFFQQHTNPVEMSDPVQRRLIHEWEELRGLLAIRCDLMAHTLNEVGADIAYQIMMLVEEQLEKDGFEPGADGFELLRRMKASNSNGS